MAVLIPTLLYYGGGWLQYGYRYFLNSVPFVMALCGLATVRQGEVGVGWRLLIVVRLPGRGGRGVLGVPPVSGTNGWMARFRARPRTLTQPEPDPGGRWKRQRLVLVPLAAIGAVLLTVIVWIYWRNPGDAFAYWLAAIRLVAGEPVYVTGEAAFAPYAYHYPPPLAQVLAPFTLVVPAIAYVIAYRAVLLLVTWELAGRRMLWMLALIAFLPVALELRFENVNLLMALGIVYGLGRWPWLFAVGAVVKVSPGLGIIYLALRRRWRDAFVSSVVGVAIVAVSYVLDPGLWREFLDAMGDRATITGNSLLPFPYAARAVAGTDR